MERKKGRYHGESNLPKKTYLHYIGKKSIWSLLCEKTGFFSSMKRMVELKIVLIEIENRACFSCVSIFSQIPSDRYRSFTLTQCQSVSIFQSANTNGLSP